MLAVVEQQIVAMFVECAAGTGWENILRWQSVTSWKATGENNAALT